MTFAPESSYAASSSTFVVKSKLQNKVFNIAAAAVHAVLPIATCKVKIRNVPGLWVLWYYKTLPFALISNCFWPQQNNNTNVVYYCVIQQLLSRDGSDGAQLLLLVCDRSKKSKWPTWPDRRRLQLKVWPRTLFLLVLGCSPGSRWTCPLQPAGHHVLVFVFDFDFDFDFVFVFALCNQLVIMMDETYWWSWWCSWWTRHTGSNLLHSTGGQGRALPYFFKFEEKKSQKLRMLSRSLSDCQWTI